MGKTKQPETEIAPPEAVPALAPDPMENDLHTARLEAQRTRDMGLLCDGCKARLQRAHAEDERNRNAVYPEGVTP